MGVGCTGKLPIMYFASKPVLWTCYIFIMPMIAFGLFGNMLSFKILGYNRSRRNQSSTFYLRALALADSMTLVFNTLLMSQQMMLRPAMNLHPLNIISLIVGSYPMCNIRMYASHTTTLISVYIIVLFSIERALVVVNPFRWMRFFTVKKAKLAVACLTVTCLLICIPSTFSFNKLYFSYPNRLYNLTTNVTIEARTLLSMANCNAKVTHVNATSQQPVQMLTNIAMMAMRERGGVNSSEARLKSYPGQSISLDPMTGIGLECQSIPECRINFPLFKHFVMFHNIALSIVPFILTGICNLIIVFALRHGEAQNLRKSKANEEQQDRQVTKKLIVVSTAFIVLACPLALYHIITVAMSGSYCNTFWANTMTITITMNAVNFAINFIIYCISEEQFRRLVVTVLMCRRHKLKRLLSYINEPNGKRRNPAGARGAPTSTGAGERKASNANTCATNYSVSQCKEQSEASVTDALVHQETLDLDSEALSKRLEAAAADYIAARHQPGGGFDDDIGVGEKPHDFKNCSLVKDDWASELFADDDPKLRALMARWSEVTPE